MECKDQDDMDFNRRCTGTNMPIYKLADTPMEVKKLIYITVSQPITMSIAWIKNDTQKF